MPFAFNERKPKMEKTALKKILAEDITLYRFPGSPLYSPGGDFLAFTVTRSDTKKNSNRGDVYMYSKGKVRQLTHTIDASVVCWYDDEHLIIRRKTEDSPSPLSTQLFMIDVTGGEALPWMTLPFPMTKMVKLPGKKWACLGFIDANDPDIYRADEETLKKYQEKIKAEEDYQVVDEVPYWFNGAGYTNKRRTSLFIVKEGEKPEIKRVTEPFFSVNSMSRDRSKVYYTGREFVSRSEWKYDLFCYDANKDNTSAIYDKSDMSISAPFFVAGKMFVKANDGKTYGVNQSDDVYRVNDDNSFEKVFVPEVTMGNGVVSDTVHGSGKTSAAFGAKYYSIETVVDRCVLCEYNSRFSRNVLLDRQGMMDGMDVAEGKIALIYQDWKHVAEVFEFDLETKTLTQLTHLNDEALKGRYVAKPNPVVYHSEGLSHRGWVLYPYGYEEGKKYPAILDIHGGPRGSYGETFFHEMQMWASEGYFVFFCNIKGSDGRGDEYADLRGRYGGVDFQNIMDFTDTVLKRYPMIDEKKVCVTGGSYGGFMTNWIIGHTDRFCAAASQRSISNWISMSTISDIGLIFGPDQCGTETIFSDFAKLWEHSPLKYAENAVTPTLFIHSTDDYRCPLPEGMQMMQALAYKGVETRLVIFKGENHELSRSGKPLHRIRRLREITDWFNRHI